MEKPALVFLSHRIPFPPNKGDKIRSFNLLKGLSRHYRIFLGAFVDDEADWQVAEKLKPYCEDMCLVGLTPVKKMRRMTAGLLQGQPLTMAVYNDSKLKDWVDTVVADHEVERAFAFSGGVAHFMESLTSPQSRCIVDFVDVDSAKWGQYATSRRWPLSLVFQRENRLLLEQERAFGARFDLSLFVSQSEAEFFLTFAPELKGCVTHVENGVDTLYFKPAESGIDPYSGCKKTIVFTGAMDYWPNIEAVERFCTDVMPPLLDADPDWHFYIVGSNPDRRVLALEGRHGTHVIGRVDDMRPWLGHATVVVAPMQIARGVQNKVLEAMAMGRPLVASSQALEGIGAADKNGVLLASTPDEYVRAITDVAKGESLTDSDRARAFVEQHFSWNRNANRLAALIEGELERMQEGERE